MRRRRIAVTIVGGCLLGLGPVVPVAAHASTARTSSSPVKAIGAENEYASVISQIGGPYVSVSAIMSNPNTDPHTFEASPSVAQEVSGAQVVVQNGVGYDTFMNRIESASPSSSRAVIDVQQLLGLPASTPNPHLWYRTTTMPAVAKAVVKVLSRLRPAHRAYFAARVRAFDASLRPWLAEIATIKARFPHVAVATTEPVADYLLQAVGADNRTPWAMQADVMNGVDPSPQAVALEERLLSKHEVRVFLYNQQVTDSLTQSFLADAHDGKVPVVGVYETMPTPGYTYQTWMLTEAKDLYRALANGTSTTRL